MIPPPERVAQRLGQLGHRIVDRPQVADHRLHQMAGGQPIDGGDREGATVGAAVAARFACDRLRQRHGRFEVAEQDEVVDVRDGRLQHVAPAVGIGLDAQQVEQQLQVEAANFGIGDRGQPRRDALGRVVADALDVDRLRARLAELARVVGRDELLVAIRQQHLRGALPQILERRLAAQRRLEDLGFGQLHQPGPAFVFGDERLEGLRQPRRGAALGDDRAGDEGGDGLVAHAIDHLRRRRRGRPAGAW